MVAHALLRFHKVHGSILPHVVVAPADCAPSGSRSPLLPLSIGPQMLQNQIIRERMGEYGVSKDEINAAVGGPAYVFATARGLDDMVQTGKPLIIGSIPRGPDQVNSCHVLCARTPSDRLIHLVVTADTFDPCVITIWCPDDGENVGYWKPGCLGPTRSGVQYNKAGTLWIFSPV